jgi:hypothetical protein
MNQTKKGRSIGTATMDSVGTIVLDLRAEGRTGEVGSGRITYKKGDRNYHSILAHLGGLSPGDTKPVPPWPDDQ